MQIKRSCRTYCCTEGPDPSDLCFPGRLVFIDPLWVRKRRNSGIVAPGKLNELDGLYSLGRTLFPMNTENTSPSRWKTTTPMMCSYSAHRAMPSLITTTTISSSSWLRSFMPPLALRKVCVCWRTLCAGKCAQGPEPCWMQTAFLNPERQNFCKASRTSLTQRQSPQRCSRKQLVWKPGITRPSVDVALVIYVGM